MVSKVLPNLIRYIVSEVQDDGFEILRTRLVKLLYLCDFYYYQSERKLITELNWIRYKYGPFAFELNEITKRLGLDLGEEELDFRIGRGVRYEILYDVPDPEKWLNIRERLVVNRVIKRWGGEDLGKLLDYVYCDTEPMIGTEFGKQLDFRKTRGGLRYVENSSIELSASDKDEIRKLQDKQSALSRKPTSANFVKPKTDKVRDELETPSISGSATLKNYQSADYIKGRE